MNPITPAQVTATLREFIAEFSNGRLRLGDVDPAAHMFDHEYIDSLSAVLLLARIDETWAIDIDDACLLEGAATVHDLAALIAGGGQA